MNPSLWRHNSNVVEIQLTANFGIVVFRGSFSWAKQFVALIGGGDPRRVAWHESILSLASEKRCPK